MGSLSNYLETKLMDHVFKTLAYTPATNLCVSLHTADPTDAGTGAEVANANAYARVIQNVWNAASARLADNNGAITFPQATGAWGTVTHWAIWDSATWGAGNMLAYGAFTLSKVIVSGNVPTIATGDLDISATTGAISTYLANKMLNHFLKTTVYTAPTNIAVALSTANPTDDGSAIIEPVAAAYVRTICNVWNAANATTGLVDNTAAITTVTATGSWGTISHAALFDLATPANWVASTVYALGAFAKPVTQNGYHYEVTTAGTSAATEPTWPTVVGNTVVDGTVTWTCRRYAGNMLWYGTISPSQLVGSNDFMEWSAGSFDVTLD